MRVTVLGIGNTLLSDEGFGPAVAAALRARMNEGAGAQWPGQIQIVDGGVLGMRLFPYFEDSDAVIVIDAMDVGAQPGALFRFTPEEAELEATRPVSAHEIALPHLLGLTHLVGANPEVVVIACQAADISTHNEEMTPAVAAAVPRAVDLVLGEVQRLTVGEEAAQG